MLDRHLFKVVESHEGGVLTWHVHYNGSAWPNGDGEPGNVYFVGEGGYQKALDEIEFAMAEEVTT